jgi:SAM-dependent methyltransferase
MNVMAQLRRYASKDVVSITNKATELLDMKYGRKIFFTIDLPFDWEEVDEATLDVVAHIECDDDSFEYDIRLTYTVDENDDIYVDTSVDDYAELVAKAYEDEQNGVSDVEGAEEIEEDDPEFEDIREIGQEFTSKNTSINSTKLPAIFKMADFEPGTVNLDYGGGKFDNVADYFTKYDIINLVYDPFNRSADHNKEVIRLVREHGGADTATLSNVLNVIKEPEVRINVLENISKLVRPDGTIYITVYEGNGLGKGTPTKAGYQLNRKTAEYLEEIQEVFPDAKRHGSLIIAHNQ